MFIYYKRHTSVVFSIPFPAVLVYIRYTYMYNIIFCSRYCMMILLYIVYIKYYRLIITFILYSQFVYYSKCQTSRKKKYLYVHIIIKYIYSVVRPDTILYSHIIIL